MREGFLYNELNCGNINSRILHNKRGGLSEKMIRLCVLGEYLIDFTPQGLSERGLPLYAQNPGGAPANVACVAAKLGTKSAVITKISYDPLGCFLYNYMEKQKVVDMRGIVRSNDPTGLAFVVLKEDRDRDFVFYRDNCADSMLSADDIDLSLLDECSIFHFSSVSLVSSVSAEATRFAARYAKEHGKIVSFDINYRAMLWDSEERAIKEVEQLLGLADIVKVSEEEAVLFGGSLEHAAEKFHGLGAKIVLITLGSQGSIYDNGLVNGLVPSYPIKAVDATGAGDNFMGAFLAWLDHSGKELDELNRGDLVEALRYSNAAGAICASRFGAIDGQASQDDIDLFLKGIQ